jgi:ATP synthase protein I
MLNIAFIGSLNRLFCIDRSYARSYTARRYGGNLPAACVPSMHQADALQAKRILTIQAVLGALAVAIALPFGGPVAVSALIGAGSSLLANLLFAATIFRRYRAQEPERLLMRFYGAEIAKLAVLLGLFAVAFKFLEGLSIPALLGAYLAPQIASNLIGAQWGDRPAKRPADRT